MSLTEYGIQTDDKLHVAVKEEIGQLACISHRHIQAVVGVVTVAYYGKIIPRYVLFEQIDGVRLSDVISDAMVKQLNIVPFSMQIADALDYMHARDITHGDIKPSNIIVVNERLAKLCNIGMKSLDRTITMKQVDDETRRYQAPEISIGREGGCAADVYSLGCVMMAMMLRYNPPILHDERSTLLHEKYTRENKNNIVYVAKEIVQTNPTWRPVARVVLNTLRTMYV